MTIDQVRDAVNADQVRRLVEAAPSADELRSAIEDGLDAIGEGLETVAGQLGRQAPARRMPWLPLALVALATAVVAMLLVSRIDRRRWTSLRDRAIAATGRGPRPAPAVEVNDGVSQSEDDAERDLHVIKIEADEGVTSDEAIAGPAVASRP